MKDLYITLCLVLIKSLLQLAADIAVDKYL